MHHGDAQAFSHLLGIHRTAQIIDGASLHCQAVGRLVVTRRHQHHRDFRDAIVQRPAQRQGVERGVFDFGQDDVGAFVQHLQHGLLGLTAGAHLQADLPENRRDLLACSEIGMHDEDANLGKVEIGRL